jgi:hypothetical protein
MEQDAVLEMLLDQLPEERQGDERRKHALTRADLRLMALLIDERMKGHPCRLQFSPEGSAVLTDWVDTLVQVKKWSVRGMILVIAAIIWGIVNIFAKHDMWPKGWWSK